MQRFTNSDQMKSFMKKEAKRLNIQIGNVYHTFVARCFLQRISKYDNHEILVKGSAAEISYLGHLVRSIVDIDLATTNSYHEAMNVFTDSVRDKGVDMFSMDFSNGIRRTPTGIYKFTLNADYGSISQPLGVDFQEHYNRLIEPEYRIMPPIFEGDEPFEVYVPSFEEYLAEKLCIIIESTKENVLNTRVKDFYDIYQLHGGKYDPDKLTEYFKKMVELRGKANIETASTLFLNKSFIEKHLDVWDHTKKRYDFIDKEIDLEGAVYYTRSVLREQLQKNGQEMADNISYQYQKCK